MNQHKIYRDKSLHIIFGITLIAVLGVASLTPAFPTIAKSFNLKETQIALLISVFTFPGIILTPISGIIADRFGRKTVLIPSLFLFAFAGFACFFIRDFQILLIFRFIQGVGASAIGSLNVTLIGDIYKGKQRAMAMGYNASVLSIGTAIYPFIGGLLATFAWYAPFILPLLAIPVGLAVIYTLKNPEPERNQDIREYFKNAYISIKNKSVIGLFIISIFTFVILYGAFLSYFPFLLSDKFGLNPFQIGLFISTSSLFTAITAAQLGKLVQHFKETTLLKIAFVLYSVVGLLVPNLDNLYLLLIPVALFGIAQGMNIPSLQTLLAAMAPIEQRAVFMSINGMVLRIGQTIGPILIGLAYAYANIDGAFYAASAVAFFVFILIFIMLNDVKKVS